MSLEEIVKKSVMAYSTMPHKYGTILFTGIASPNATQMSAALEAKLLEAFDSIVDFKQAFTQTALTTFGSAGLG